MAPYIEDVPATLPIGGPTAGGDEFDDLLDYDIGGADDPFADLDTIFNPKPSESAAKKVASAGAGLGIDEAVEVAKKVRAPRVKLDENRLLSQAGITKLRKRAKDLKFKGKGHEYSDAARLLSFYQLWLDDLFPKAKFLDAAAMVEKLGHKRRMQVMRMEWINEAKPRSSVHEDSVFDEPALPPREETAVPQRIAPIFDSTAREERLKTPEVNGDLEEDIYDATPLAQRTKTLEQPQSLFGSGNTSFFGPKTKNTTAPDEEPEDDLDALLAEHEMELDGAVAGHITAGAPSGNTVAPEPNFDDDMDAMEAMGGMDDMW